MEGLTLGVPTTLHTAEPTLGRLSVSETAITTRYLWAIALFWENYNCHPARHRRHCAKHKEVFVFACGDACITVLSAVGIPRSVGGKRV